MSEAKQDHVAEGGPSKAELLKINSGGLRGNLREELASDSPRFGPIAETLIKFHGMYQQKDRDRRRPDAPEQGPKPFTLMVRGRIPGGLMTPAQWQGWDEVASRYAVSGLRLTTRQSLQIHGVLKSNIKATIQEINKALITTTGACGDVVRNVTLAVNPTGNPRLSQLEDLALLLSKHFEVDSNAYFEIFLDGEAIVEEREDPIYGRHYLPRKFKIGVTAAGDNSIDLYTQDLSFAATYDARERIDGYFVFVGGGMGMSHSDANTHPRLADLLGWTPREHVLKVAEAVVATQKDHGNRQDRTFARLKYLLDLKGAAWFRNEVEQRAEIKLQDRPLPAFKTPNYLGWSRHQDGTLTLGLHLLSGRVNDQGKRPIKSAIRTLLQSHGTRLQLTPDQDLLIFGIKPEEKNKVESILDAHGLSAITKDKLYDRALTCVALPTCSKALAEAERVGEQVFADLNAALLRYGKANIAPVVRITGCPNGCARPYTAELALVGQMPQTYAIYAGGSSEGSRLAVKVKDKVKFADLPTVFDKLAAAWQQLGLVEEHFGDFAHRLGPKALGELL